MELAMWLRIYICFVILSLSFSWPRKNYKHYTAVLLWPGFSCEAGNLFIFHMKGYVCGYMGVVCTWKKCFPWLVWNQVLERPIWGSTMDGPGFKTFTDWTIVTIQIVQFTSWQCIKRTTWTTHTGHLNWKWWVLVKCKMGHSQVACWGHQLGRSR